MFNFDEQTAGEVLAALRAEAEASVLQELTDLAMYLRVQEVAKQVKVEIAGLEIRVEKAEAKFAEVEAVYAKVVKEYAPSPAGAVRGELKERQQALDSAAVQVDDVRSDLVALRSYVRRRKEILATLQAQLDEGIPEVPTLRLLFAKLAEGDEGSGV